ncbi:MAG TPA: HhH-GPD-type base excision DNA repair protein, partial [Actinomycetes bacterium]|nr:HhH-GPD-type base excision DNA repair protein [Actinomycetes bacterium]
MAPPTLRLAQDPDADALLARDPLALLMGMLLDQQFPLEWAFRAPWRLAQRMERTSLDAAELAGWDPDEFVKLMAGPPALHRYPASMAGRVQALCRIMVDEYGGDAAAIWTTAATGKELFARLRALPGFGEQKARIFVALLAKRLGVRPRGWEEVTGAYGQPGYFSVADVDGPEALARVREHKKAVKAEAKAAQPAAKAAKAAKAVKRAKVAKAAKVAK